MSEAPKRTKFGFEPRDPFIGTIKITAADIVENHRMTQPVSVSPRSDGREVEAGAEAAHLVVNPTLPWAGVHENGKEIWRQCIRAAIEAMRAHALTKDDQEGTAVCETCKLLCVVGMKHNCPGTPPPPPSDAVERVARAIHEGLGGNGWAYSDYGDHEWEDCRDKLNAAARAAIAAIASMPDTMKVDHIADAGKMVSTQTKKD